jgi:hypothetical protein
VAVPPEPVLRAAVRWLDRLPASGAARIRALFATHSDFSDITPTQYEAAFAWLQTTGLLDDLHTGISGPRRIFDAVVTYSGAAWLPDADLLVRNTDELPDDIVDAALALGLSKHDAFRQLGAVWGKINTRERERVGAAGELAVVRILSVSTTARVEHVAAWSDGFGYDVAVYSTRYPTHLEIKSTTRRGRLTIFLSRNEYETLRHDPYWELIVIRLSADLQPEAIATVPKRWIAEQAPADRGTRGRWESFRLDVPAEVPVPGIPRLAHAFVTGCSELLDGTAGWPG